MCCIKSALRIGQTYLHAQRCSMYKPSACVLILVKTHEETNCTRDVIPYKQNFQTQITLLMFCCWGYADDVVVKYYCCPYQSEGEDYEGVSESVLMEAGFKPGACSPLTLSVIKDGVLESDETVQLSATDTSSRAIPSSNNGATTLITITDDDSACEWCSD